MKKDVRFRQWGTLCLLVDACTGRDVRVPVPAALALGLCYGHFSLAQILDLVSHVCGVSPAETIREIRPAMERCRQREMFASGPDAVRGATEPLCDPQALLAEASRGKTPAGPRYPDPLFLVSVLTDRCHMACPWCFRNSGAGGNAELTAGEWLHVVDQAIEMGIVRCFVTGGEPTMHPGFLEIVRRLLDRGVYPYISTNGLCWTDRMIRTLAEAGLPRIQVSLDAADAVLFARITGIPDGYERVLEHIRRLVAAGIEVMVKTVVTPLNFAELENIVKLCATLGVRIVDFEPCGNAPFGRGGREFLLSDSDRREAAQRLQEIPSRFRDTLTVMGHGLETKNRWETLPDDCRSCGGLISSVVVQPNGDVGPCELMPTVAALRLGNVRHTPLRALWDSPPADRFAVPPKELLNEPCRSCEYLNRCRAGCRAFALLYSDNPFAPDPRCPRVSLAGNPLLPTAAEDP